MKNPVILTPPQVAQFSPDLLAHYGPDYPIIEHLDFTELQSYFYSP